MYLHKLTHPDAETVIFHVMKEWAILLIGPSNHNIFYICIILKFILDYCNVWFNIEISTEETEVMLSPIGT